VISRYLIITLAFGAAAFRVTQGAWVEATGLGSLGAGLLLLKLAGARPALKPAAWVCFGITICAMGVVILRM
jgi:hypothetical protein